MEWTITWKNIVAKELGDSTPLNARFCFVIFPFVLSESLDQATTIIIIIGYCSSLLWWRGGLVVSMWDFQSGGRWFEPGLSHRVVSLFHIVSLHRGV